MDLGKRMADYNRIKEKVDRAREVNQQQVINLRNIDVNKNVDQDTVSILEHASEPAAVPGTGCARHFARHRPGASSRAWLIVFFCAWLITASFSSRNWS